jgi:hypothetical protein
VVVVSRIPITTETQRLHREEVPLTVEHGRNSRYSEATIPLLSKECLLRRFACELQVSGPPIVAGPIFLA